MAEVRRWKGQAEWDSKHMGTLGTKMRIETVQAFKAYAAERGTTAGALLAGYVRRCLEEDQAEKSNKESSSD